MKIQDLAIIFVIIILPISLILSVYTQFQIQTINMQTLYDAKLTSATYDAIRAFQLNAANSTTSDIANSKLRDLEASVATFRNSIMSAFELNGYTEDDLNNYIPALVYTLYDGFYIYSPYQNTNYKGIDDDGQNIYGLKPYITYSCKYVQGNIDVVITYTLDNYITVQGMIGNEYVNESGYLIDGIKANIENDLNYTIEYNGVDIILEQLEEYLPIQVNGVNQQSYPYVKINGTKYYKIPNPSNPDKSMIISFLNGSPIIQYKEGVDDIYTIYDFLITNNKSAKEYYKKAYEFTKWFKSKGLHELKHSSAYDEIINDDGTTEIRQIYPENSTKIFDFNQINSTNYNENIENESSTFNQHRLEIIRHKIETNLAVAISNYNDFSGATSNVFEMPELKENEWDCITNNISLISFLQGLSIGGKIYNGYTLVTNSESEEVVLEENIYILGDDGAYHRIGDSCFEDGSVNVDANIYGKHEKNAAGQLISTGSESAGRWNIDFERKLASTDNSLNYTLHYYPLKKFDASYNSIVMQNDVTTYDDIYKYINEHPSYELKQAFYMAVGRERETLYRDYNVQNVYGGFSDKDFCYVTAVNTAKNEEKSTFVYVNDIYGSILEPPSKEGHKFIGWFDKDGNQYSMGDECLQAGSLKVESKWEEITYKLTFIPSENEKSIILHEKQINHGDLYGALPTTLEDRYVTAGKKFAGWQLAHGKIEIEPDRKFKASQVGTLEEPYIVYVIPVLEDLIYTITYDGNGTDKELTVPKPEEDLRYGDEVTLAGGPLRTGYHFLGWSTDQYATQPTYTAGEKIICRDSMNLYAIWAQNYLTVKYHSNYATSSFENPDTAVRGDRDVIVKQVKYKSYTEYSNGLNDYTGNAKYWLKRTWHTGTGYWNTSDDEYSISEKTSFANGQALAEAFGLTLVDGNKEIDVYAQWEVNALTVRYYSNGATSSPSKNVSDEAKAAMANGETSVKVYEYKFKYNTEYSDGLQNYSAENSYIELKREKYTATGKWKRITEDASYTVDEDDSFDSGQKLAEAFGETLENGSVKINVHAQWKADEEVIMASGVIQSGYSIIPAASDKTKANALLSDTNVWSYLWGYNLNYRTGRTIVAFCNNTAGYAFEADLTNFSKIEFSGSYQSNDHVTSSTSTGISILKADQNLYTNKTKTYENQNYYISVHNFSNDTQLYTTGNITKNSKSNFSGSGNISSYKGKYYIIFWAHAGAHDQAGDQPQIKSTLSNLKLTN